MRMPLYRVAFYRPRHAVCVYHSLTTDWVLLGAPQDTNKHVKEHTQWPDYSFASSVRYHSYSIDGHVWHSCVWVHRDSLGPLVVAELSTDKGRRILVVFFLGNIRLPFEQSASSPHYNFKIPESFAYKASAPFPPSIIAISRGQKQLSEQLAK